MTNPRPLVAGVSGPQHTRGGWFTGADHWVGGSPGRGLLMGLMAVVLVGCDSREGQAGPGAGAPAPAAVASPTQTTARTTPSTPSPERSSSPAPGPSATAVPPVPAGRATSDEAREPATPARPTPEPLAVGLTFVTVSDAVPGGMASVTVQTTPWASCSIRYATPLGTVSTAEGLTAKLADAVGRVSWSWAVGSGTSVGIGTVSVTCGAFSASSPIRIG